MLFLDFVELCLRDLVYLSKKLKGFLAAADLPKGLALEGSTLLVASLRDLGHAVGLEIFPVPLDIGQSANFLLVQLNLGYRMVHLSLDILGEQHRATLVYLFSIMDLGDRSRNFTGGVLADGCIVR